MDSLAYVDGTTGGMVIQLLLGGFVGGFVVFKLAFQSLFHRVFRRGASPEDDADVVEEPTDQAA